MADGLTMPDGWQRTPLPPIPHAFTIEFSGDTNRPYAVGCACGSRPGPLAADEMEPWMRLHWRGSGVTR